MRSNILIISAVSDDPFAIDVAHYSGQAEDISDLISLRRYANTEFCPRFISDEEDMTNIGECLAGKTVVIVSTCCGSHTRNALAMRNCILARAAKDNGAKKVLLVEPDLYFSAQDRGPRKDHGNVLFKRTAKDFKKFDGQPFSSLLYAQMLKMSGVDEVVTIHNHSVSVQELFSKLFNEKFHNLIPSGVYAHYLIDQNYGLTSGSLVLCAPDKGAAPFVEEVAKKLTKDCDDYLIKPKLSVMMMSKERTGERKVSITAAKESPTKLGDLKGKVVVVFDDMVRTGSTIVECCKVLKKAGAKKVIFVVTHFHPSDEVKENLNDPSIDEIVTTNTLPAILNRDMQGRLRKKMMVLKIERWIAAYLREVMSEKPIGKHETIYTIDISSKNPHWDEVPHRKRIEPV